MLFFLHQHFVMPFSLRMYYLLVSSLLRFPSPLPSMSSITDSGYPTLTTPCFKCGPSLAVLHSRFPPFSAQLAPTCLYYPQVLDTTFLSRLSLISTSAKYLPASSRYTISTHCDFFFFRDLQRCILIYPLILTMKIPLFRHSPGCCPPAGTL